MLITLGATHVLSAGEHLIPEQEHRGMRGHQVHLDISQHTNPNETMYVVFEVSTDGGKTWVDGGGFTCQGGVHLGKDGQPLTEATAVFGHEPDPRQPACPHRLVRGTLRVDGTDIPTRLHMAGVPNVHFDVETAKRLTA